MTKLNEIESRVLNAALAWRAADLYYEACRHPVDLKEAAEQRDICLQRVRSLTDDLKRELTLDEMKMNLSKGTVN